MREKILTQLVTKYAGVSKTALGLIADKLSKKVTEESGIDQAITDFDNAISISEYAADLQKEADRRVGDAKKEWEKKNPPKPADSKTDPANPNPPAPDEAPAWAKSLMERVETLTKEKAQGTMKSKATELLKEVPAKFWNGRALPDKEEDMLSFVEAVNRDFTEFKQEQIDKGFMSATPPAGAGGADGKSNPAADKVIDAEIKEWADKSKPTTTDNSTKK